jgi:hypothetical protein
MLDSTPWYTFELLKPFDTRVDTCIIIEGDPRDTRLRNHDIMMAMPYEDPAGADRVDILFYPGCDRYFIAKGLDGNWRQVPKSHLRFVGEG